MVAELGEIQQTDWTSALAGRPFPLSFPTAQEREALDDPKRMG